MINEVHYGNYLYARHLDRKIMKSTNFEFPPGPSSIIPGKLIRQFARDPISTLTNIADEYGDISHFKLGRQHVYLINNPDYIEKVLIYDHSNFKKGPRLQNFTRNRESSFNHYSYPRKSQHMALL
jgi:hypothetical protein